MCCGPSTMEDQTRRSIRRRLLAILPTNSFDIPNQEASILDDYPKLNDWLSLSWKPICGPIRRKAAAFDKRTHKDSYVHTAWNFNQPKRGFIVSPRTPNYAWTQPTISSKPQHFLYPDHTSTDHSE